MHLEPPLAFKNPQPTVGVLTNSEMLLVDIVGGKRVVRSLQLPARANTQSELLDYLWEADLTQVWVLPASTFSHTFTSDSLEQARPHWHVVFHPHAADSSRPTSILLWPGGSDQQRSRRLVLAFPEYTGWNWELSDARSLLATVTYLDQVLGRSLIDTPEMAGHQLLSELAGEQPSSLLRSSWGDLHDLSSSDDLPLPVLDRAQHLAWMRPLTLVEQRERYLHKYSHLSLALEAALSIRLGSGESQYSANGRAYDGARPGIWRVNAQRVGSVFDGTRLPSCLDGEWMSTSQVQCCRDIGYQVQVREGYCWQESHALLKEWATTLWRAGERLHTQPQLFRHAQARTNASHAITKLADLGVTSFSQEQATGWWASLVGGSRATLFAHLVRLVRKGIMPVLVAHNALWVVSNDPNPLTAVPDLAKTRNWHGYTPGYTAPLPLSTDLRDTLRTTKDAVQMAQVLDTLAREVFP